MRARVSPGGAFLSSKFRTKERPIWAKDRARPRPLSTITSMSFMNCSTSKKADTGAHSLVRRLRASIAEAPQLGWQEQLSCPNGASGELMWSASDANDTPRPEREPVAQGVDLAAVVAREVVGQVRGRVALAVAGLVADLLVASGEGHGLEGGSSHLAVVVHAEVHDRTHALVVQPVDDGDHGRDLDARRVHVVDGDLLHVEEVRDLAVGVGLVGHAVELQVGHVEAGLLGLGREIRLQGEAQAVGGRLHHLVADLLRVPAGGEEVRGERRLPARELHRHLPPRLEGDGVVEDAARSPPW